MLPRVHCRHNPERRWSTKHGICIDGAIATTCLMIANPSSFALHVLAENYLSDPLLLHEEIQVVKALDKIIYGRETLDAESQIETPS